jgi:hypothetical protein
MNPVPRFSVPGLLGQLAIRRTPEQVSQKGPVRIWAGANDYILATPAELEPELVDQVVGNITMAIRNCTCWEPVISSY